MVPGLHPNTRPQRKRSGDGWAEAGRHDYETQEPPPFWVGVGLAGILGTLIVSVVCVLWFVGSSRPRLPEPPATARAQFHPVGPGLLVHPPVERAALERAHAAPEGAALDRATAAVLAQGWGDTGMPPSRADTALKRAEASR